MKIATTLNKLINYFDLESELDDFEKIHQTIIKDSIFKGTNLWILIFAIIIASVGLNMNSAAVIIGAMLVSPLMGPINGMGYSIATYDFQLFRKAIKNFSFAVLASLVTSTIYFSLSPVSTAHSELLARTTPTIYDVLIALFGGLAGIVAISSKQKGNVIPGVAIATALMPPLCTAGYGLATFQLDFFFGAIYLFTINTVFIAIASVAISQILKFPIRTDIPVAQKKYINRWISIVLLAVILPSIYFGYDLVQKEKFRENANSYVLNVSAFEGNYLLNSEVDVKDKTITLIYGGISLSKSQKTSIAQKASNFKLDDTKILIKQGLSFSSYNEDNRQLYLLREEINKLNGNLKEKQNQLDSISRKSVTGKIILNEIKILYPQIASCLFAESIEYNDSILLPRKTAIIVFSLNNGNMNDSDKQKIYNWLKTRLKQVRIEVVYKRNFE